MAFTAEVIARREIRHTNFMRKIRREAKGTFEEDEANQIALKIINLLELASESALISEYRTASEIGKALGIAEDNAEEIINALVDDEILGTSIYEVRGTEYYSYHHRFF